MNFLPRSVVLTCLVLAGWVCAQSLDNGFQPNVNNTVYAVAVQSDGKYLLAGQFSNVNGGARAYVARVRTDGILDSTFDPGVGPDGIVRCMAIQPDGKIIIGGEFMSVALQARNRIARLNTDGSLDTTFAPASGTDNPVYGVAIQPDGKILAVGAFSNFSGVARSRIARLNTDGSIDNTFTPGTGANNTLNAVAVYPDGKIAIGGDHTFYDGLPMRYVSRLNSDGTPDTGFGGGTSPNAQVRCLAVQADGNLVIGGDFTVLGGTTAVSRIARLLANGTRDTSFPVTGPDGPVHCICNLPDRRMVFGGAFSTFHGSARANIACTDLYGNLDSSSFWPFTSANSPVFCATVTKEQKILVGGQFTAFDGQTKNRVARLRQSGFVDGGFRTGNIVSSGFPWTVTVQSNERLLLGGGFSQIWGFTAYSVGRLFANGQHDSSLNSYNPTVGGYPYVTVILPNGNLVVAGSFSSINGVPRNNIARLLGNDGSGDFSFNPGAGSNGPIYAVSLQSDGKLVIGGAFSSFDGAARGNIARVSSNGALDTLFAPNTDGTVRTLATLPDGKILLGGTFLNVAGAPRSRIARVNPDGSIDTTFNPGSGPNNEVDALAVQHDGKVLIAGPFTSVGGTTRNGIARLNADGSLDTSFDAGAGPGDLIRSMAIQTDGRILVVGRFVTLCGVTRNRVGRLNSDGSLDTAFDPGVGPNAEVFSLAVQNDGTTVLGGGFSLFGATTVGGVTRLTNTNTALQDLTLVGNTVRWKPQGSLPMPMRVSFDFGGYGSVEGTWSGTDWRATSPPFGITGWISVTVRAYVAAGFYNGSSYAVGMTKSFYVQSPVVGFSFSLPTYTENDPPMILDAAATVTHPNNTSLDNGVMLVQFMAGQTADDIFSITTTSTVRMAGSNVEYDGSGLFAGGQVVVGTVPASGAGSGYGGQNLIVSFNAASTPAIAQEVLRAVAYSNTSENPSVSARSMRVIVWDGEGGSNTMNAWRTINVVAVNDAPTLTVVAPLTGGTEDTQYVSSFAALESAADEADVDSATLSFRIENVVSGTLTINGGPVTSGSTLFASGDQLEWMPDANANGSLVAFTIVAWDGAIASSTPISVLVDVAPVNDVPTLTTVTNLTGAAEDVQFVITHAALAVAADEADVETSPLEFRIESVASGVLTLNGAAIAAGTTLVTSTDQLEWTPDADDNGVIAAFSVVAWDGTSASSSPVSVSIVVTAVNDAPSITAPSSGATAENTALTFSGTISFQDADAGSAAVQVTLTVSNGILTLATTTGLAFVSGSNGTSTMTIQGTLADINSAVTGLIFSPATGFNGLASIQVVIDDLGNTGGAALTDSANISVQVGSASGGSGGGDDGGEDGGCSTAEASRLVEVATLVAMFAVAAWFGRRKRRRAAAMARE